jgi:hypothetical protein
MRHSTLTPSNSLENLHRKISRWRSRRLFSPFAFQLEGLGGTCAINRRAKLLLHQRMRAARSPAAHQVAAGGSGGDLIAARLGNPSEASQAIGEDRTPWHHMLLCPAINRFKCEPTHLAHLDSDRSTVLIHFQRCHERHLVL